MPPRRRNSSRSAVIHGSDDSATDSIEAVKQSLPDNSRLFHFVLKKISSEDAEEMGELMLESAPSSQIQQMWNQYEPEKLYRRLLMLKKEEKKALDEARKRYAMQRKWIIDSCAEN